jgi:hypothetical protein
MLDRTAGKLAHAYDPVFAEISEELARAHAKFPNDTGLPGDRAAADLARRTMDAALRDRTATWRQVLEEEVRKAFAETDPAALRAELIQTAAMCARWIRDIDLREATP